MVIIIENIIEILYKRLDNLESCKDNEIYAKEIENLRCDIKDVSLAKATLEELKEVFGNSTTVDKLRKFLGESITFNWLISRDYVFNNNGICSWDVIQ